MSMGPTQEHEHYWVCNLYEDVCDECGQKRTQENSETTLQSPTQ